MPIPRGIRMNNPMNIKELPGDKTKWVGERATDDDPIFEEFNTVEYGIRAGVKILLGYQTRYGLKTIRQIVSRYAPPEDDNNTPAYMMHMADVLGVGVDDTIDLTDANTMCVLVAGIILHENGQQPYPQRTIARGVDMGLGLI